MSKNDFRILVSMLAKWKCKALENKSAVAEMAVSGSYLQEGENYALSHQLHFLIMADSIINTIKTFPSVLLVILHNKIEILL